jgi:hypothetical protein
VLLLRSQSLLGQAQHLAAGGGGVRLCDRAAVTLQPAGAHRIGLLRDPRHSRQVADAHSGGAEDTQRVGTDRERDPRFPLDVDGERQQDAGHELRQVSGGRASCSGTCRRRAGECRFRLAVLCRDHEGQEIRGVEGEVLEDRPERALQVVHSLISEAGAPTPFHGGREGAPDHPGPPARNGGADECRVLWRVPQRLARRRCQYDVPPPPETSEEQPIGARPGA